MTTGVVLVFFGNVLLLVSFLPWRGERTEWCDGFDRGTGLAGLFMGLTGVALIVAEHWRP